MLGSIIISLSLLFRIESSRRDQQITFARLYDELIMSGKLFEKFELNNFFDTDN